MKTKTSDLKDIALDFMVTKAGGGKGDVAMFIAAHADYDMFHYSTNWAQGGPIIEQERINLTFCAGFWRATKDDRPTSGEHAEEDGPTVLIAALRCVVASKLGDEVDVPEEVL